MTQTTPLLTITTKKLKSSSKYTILSDGETFIIQTNLNTSHEKIQFKISNGELCYKSISMKEWQDSSMKDYYSNFNIITNTFGCLGVVKVSNSSFSTRTRKKQSNREKNNDVIHHFLIYVKDCKSIGFIDDNNNEVFCINQIGILKLSYENEKNVESTIYLYLDEIK
jgi:hypothetical protein